MRKARHLACDQKAYDQKLLQNSMFVLSFWFELSLRASVGLARGGKCCRKNGRDMSEESLVPDPLKARIKQLKRAFAKGLGHRATRLQALAIDRAARLTALSEAALASGASATDITRLDNCASRARRDMDAMLEANSPEHQHPSLAEMLAAS